ncbi:MAG: NAD(P)-binding domain-containing protein [Actinomycetota bacterium]|nr:NAD(P)-binding domain-containing protein [Actinomycetota bacterium]
MNILLFSPIDSEAVKGLDSRHTVVDATNGYADLSPSVMREQEVIVFRSGVSVSSAIMDMAPELKLLVRAGSGLDNVDLGHARARGVRLVRVPGPSAQAVAELTFALMLALARKVVLADRELRRGHWPKRELGGPLLMGKTLGIVGAGNIGARVGELGAAWGMNVIGCVDRYSEQCAAMLGARGIELKMLNPVLSEADFVTVHVPLSASTRNLIGSQAMSMMKPGAYLINTSRGGIVDEQALFGELIEGRIAGAALDVHEREGEGTISPLGELPNVVLTPHIGGMALDSQRDIGRRIVQIISSFDEGRIEEEAQSTELVL